jgi:hypothetical protein
MEIWKEIEDYPGYEVSNLGNVRRWHRWPNKDGVITFTMLKPNKLNKRNYYLIRVSKDSEPKAMLLHRVVAKAFIPNPNNLPIVMHLDDNGFNNKVENLKWGTISENTQDAFNKGLMPKTRTRKQKI